MTRRVLGFAIACAAVLAGAATVHAADAQPAGIVQRVAAATAAFREATAAPSPDARAAAFRHAAELYSVALDDGPRNGALEYNAANAWLLAGDVGRAVLHYRRALEIRPGDPRVTANIATARGRRRDSFDEAPTRALTDTLLFWHHGLPLRAKTTVALGAWSLGFVLLAVGAWLAPGRLGRAGCRRCGGVALVAAFALGASAGVDLRAQAVRDGAVVLADEVALRTGDGESYPARYENPIHSGAEVRVVEERAGWVDVELPDGKRGWVRADAVERI